MKESKNIPISDIDRDPDQPRKQFDEQELLGLGRNMQVHGQQVPVIVYSQEAPGSGPAKQYRLLDGERRWRAAQVVGLAELDAIVLAERPSVTALHLLQMSLEAHKQGLTPMERSNLLRKIQSENNWSVGELALNLHMKQPVVSKLLAYQKLDPSIQTLLNSGALDTERAFILSQEPDAVKQQELLKSAQTMTRDELRQKARTATDSGSAKATNARFPLSTGLCITVQGREVTLAGAIDAMLEAAKELKKGQAQGLDITTAQRVMRDKARSR